MGLSTNQCGFQWELLSAPSLMEGTLWSLHVSGDRWLWVLSSAQEISLGGTQKTLMPWAERVFIGNPRCQVVPKIPLISRCQILRSGCAIDLMHTFCTCSAHNMPEFWNEVSAVFAGHTRGPRHCVHVLAMPSWEHLRAVITFKRRKWRILLVRDINEISVDASTTLEFWSGSLKTQSLKKSSFVHLTCSSDEGGGSWGLPKMWLRFLTLGTLGWGRDSWYLELVDEGCGSWYLELANERHLLHASTSA